MSTRYAMHDSQIAAPGPARPKFAPGPRPYEPCGAEGAEWTQMLREFEEEARRVEEAADQEEFEC